MPEKWGGIKSLSQGQRGTAKVVTGTFCSLYGSHTKSCFHAQDSPKINILCLTLHKKVLTGTKTQMFICIMLQEPSKSALLHLYLYLKSGPSQCLVAVWWISFMQGTRLTPIIHSGTHLISSNSRETTKCININGGLIEVVLVPRRDFQPLKWLMCETARRRGPTASVRHFVRDPRDDDNRLP